MREIIRPRAPHPVETTHIWAGGHRSYCDGALNSGWKGLVPNDGAQILAQLLNVPQDLHARRAAVHMVRATYAYHDRDHATAVSEAAAAAALFKELRFQCAVLALQAEALSESGNPRAAMELLAPLRTRIDLDDETRVHVDQAHAWAALLDDESVQIEDAIPDVARGAMLVPWSDVIHIKHICLLAASANANPGRVAEARRLAGQLSGFDLQGESRAYAALARGLVAAAEGNAALAHAEYRNATGAGVSAQALQVLERRIASH